MTWTHHSSQLFRTITKTTQYGFVGSSSSFVAKYLVAFVRTTDCTSATVTTLLCARDSLKRLRCFQLIGVPNGAFLNINVNRPMEMVS